MSSRGAAGPNTAAASRPSPRGAHGPRVPRREVCHSQVSSCLPKGSSRPALPGLHDPTRHARWWTVTRNS
eukprot:566245-Prymnesium_polylepis.1